MSQGSGGAWRADSQSGEEILVVDAGETVLRGLEKLFREAGMSVTAVSSVESARDQLANRFFPVALIDLDTPTTGQGLELLEFAKVKSPLTAVVIMTLRQGFEPVAAAFRAGAADVVPKAKEAIPYLRSRVQEAARNITTAVKREKLLAEVAEMHELFLKELMDLSRRVVDLEDRLLSGADGSGGTQVVGPVNLLIVDDEPALPAILERALPGDKGWRVRVVQSGGEALDIASQVNPHVLLVKETLPDLPGSMVLKTLKATSGSDALCLLFSPPVDDEQPGQVKMVDGPRTQSIVPAFTDPAQLLTALEEVRQALKRKAKELRYLQTFKKDHFEFLKRYNLMKQRLGAKL